MTIRKTISFTEQHDEWIKSRIASGSYTSDSEYVRDLIRKDQQDNQKLLILKAAIAEGLESGISNRSVQDIMKDVEQRLGTNGAISTDT